MIKPSSPTHLNKSIYLLSLLDQLAPSVYTSILLFYPNDPSINNRSIEQISNSLKKSLSETLVDFYPLAGRIKQNELIECNDKGVEFCEAHFAEKNIPEFIENPSIQDLRGLLPFEREPAYKNLIMSVQINYFGCGGMVIGGCFSHKIGDAIASAGFLKNWAAKTKQSDHNNNVSATSAIFPVFNGATIFPPSKQLNEGYFNPNFDDNERIATRRLIFDKNAINMIMIDSAISPTTSVVEAITAFIWKQLPKIVGVVHFVDLRTRIVPRIRSPRGGSTFGNIAFFTKATSVNDESMMITELRKAIKKVNNEYIQELFIKEGCMLKLEKEMYELYGNSENCLFFSSLPMYELDFGMGMPIWVCAPSTIAKNRIILTKTKCGQGIEASICMLEDDIAMLDHSFSQLGYPLVKTIEMM